MSTAPTARTEKVFWERSYLMRVVQRYAVEVDTELAEAMRGDAPEDWHHDQFVCDNGTLLADEDDVIDDDNLEYRALELDEVPLEQVVVADQYARRLVDAAHALCEGSRPGSEYVRAQAELVCDALGLSTDRKDEVSAHLTRTLPRTVEPRLDETVTESQAIQALSAHVEAEAEFTARSVPEGGGDGTYGDFLADLHRRLGRILGLE